MKKIGLSLLLLLTCILVIAIGFALTVLIASLINNVGFYDQLCLWFGHESGFAKIFIK